MKKERFIVEIEMPDGDGASSAYICDVIQCDCDVEDEGRWKVSVKECWKPSDEQMRVLDLAIRCGINRGTIEEITLVSLFNDLKKLREEYYKTGIPETDFGKKEELTKIKDSESELSHSELTEYEEEIKGLLFDAGDKYNLDTDLDLAAKDLAPRFLKAASKQFIEIKDEQMLSLERASNSLVSKEDTLILRKLLEQLKKLREE